MVELGEEPELAPESPKPPQLLQPESGTTLTGDIVRVLVHGEEVSPDVEKQIIRAFVFGIFGFLFFGHLVCSRSALAGGALLRGHAPCLGFSGRVENQRLPS